MFNAQFIDMCSKIGRAPRVGRVKGQPQQSVCQLDSISALVKA